MDITQNVYKIFVDILLKNIMEVYLILMISK